MKRKTNLFYLYDTQDNNFLSLSNYSESLTGNLLSTDNKIFPSSFLCLNLKKLYDEDNAKKLYEEQGKTDWDSITGYDKKSLIFQTNKQEFIMKYLVPYYENKMAALRDWCINNNYNQELKLLPLNYLLDTIYKYEGLSEEEIKQDNRIVYLGNVTEQDYNGTYTDTICVVDPTQTISATPTIDNTTTSIYAKLDNESTEYLHGWYNKKVQYDPQYDFNKDGEITLSLYKSDENYFLAEASQKWEEIKAKYNFVSNDLSDDFNEYYRLCKKGETAPDKAVSDKIIELAKYQEVYHGPSMYENTQPVYDKLTDTELDGIQIPEYEITSNISGLTINRNSEDINELEFNIVIPMYDIVDCNYSGNTRKIDETIEKIDLGYNEYTSEQMVQFVPLGIWFSGPKPVDLTVDPESKCGTTWSLSIANQFKPFPVSDKMPSEITDDSKKDAFMTFAQILSSQSELITKMSDIMVTISTMNQRLSNVESAVASVLTSYNLDSFRQEMNDFKIYTNTQISALTEKIKDLDLKWVNKEA